jgi:hypothetical protein
MIMAASDLVRVAAVVHSDLMLTNRSRLVPEMLTRLLLLAPLVAGGCDPGDDSDESGTASAAGTVRRGVDVASGNDGKGTLYVAALDVCDLSGGGTILGFAAVPDADLAGTEAAVPFRVEALPRATVHLAVFLDDDGDATPQAPRPGLGDLVYTRDAGDGVVDCIAVELGDGDVADVEIVLNVVEE